MNDCVKPSRDSKKTKEKKHGNTGSVCELDKNLMKRTQQWSSWGSWTCGLQRVTMSFVILGVSQGLWIAAARG